MFIKLTKHYGEQVVFSDLRLNIIKGKIHTMLGPSGCGKSTLLKGIAGLEDYEGSSDINQKHLSYVFQEDRLFPWFTVYKNLEIINEDRELIDRYLKRFGLYNLKNKYPSQLSGGEKQRISIIRTFIHNKPLILLDEPYKSLDYNLKWELVDMLATFQKEQRSTVLLVTHDLDIALYLSDTVYVLSEKPTTVKLTIENTNKRDLTSKITTQNRIQIMNAL